jgi:hypothetical protein
MRLPSYTAAKPSAVGDSSAVFSDFLRWEPQTNHYSGSLPVSSPSRYGVSTPLYIRCATKP